MPVCVMRAAARWQTDVESSALPLSRCTWSIFHFSLVSQLHWSAALSKLPITLFPAAAFTVIYSAPALIKPLHTARQAPATQLYWESEIFVVAFDSRLFPVAAALTVMCSTCFSAKYDRYSNYDGAIWPPSPPWLRFYSWNTATIHSSMSFITGLLPIIIDLQIAIMLFYPQIVYDIYIYISYIINIDVYL